MSGIRIMIEQYGPLFDVWIDGMRHYDLDRDAVYQLVNDSLYPKSEPSTAPQSAELTERQQQVMQFLSDEPKANTRRVAGGLEMRSQDAGRVLKSLQRRGLVELFIGEHSAGWRVVA